MTKCELIATLAGLADDALVLIGIDDAELLSISRIDVIDDDDEADPLTFWAVICANADGE
jgi:hypothetical protein